MPCRNPHRLYIHLAFTHSLRWSLNQRSVKRTWTGSAFSTNESAWSVMVTGSQSCVWSGPKQNSIGHPDSRFSHPPDLTYPVRAIFEKVPAWMPPQTPRMAWQHGCLPLTYMNTRSNTPINCWPRREVRLKNPMISSLLEMVVPIVLIIVQEGCKNILRKHQLGQSQ